MISDSQQTPEYLVAAAREALAEDPRVAELEIDLTVTGERLVVGGTVPTQERRRAVTEVLQERFPRVEVVNQISVLEPGPLAREEDVS